MTGPKLVLACCVMVTGLASAACAPKRSLVVLAPSPDGSTGRVAVSNAGGSVDIEKANDVTTIADSTSAPTAPAPMSAEEIRRIFGQALAATPAAPVHFVLFFDSDSTELRPESAARLPEIVAAIRERGADLISVVGHSDSSGDTSYNVALSTRRALAVKNRLLALGIAEAALLVTSHGEAIPLVATGDNVKEERNRRVEVVVR